MTERDPTEKLAKDMIELNPLVGIPFRQFTAWMRTVITSPGACHDPESTMKHMSKMMGEMMHFIAQMADGDAMFIDMPFPGTEDKPADPSAN